MVESTQPTSDYQQRVQHQLAYWDQFRRAQPRGGEVELFPLSGQGTVYSFTTVTTPSEDFEQFAPYLLALVKLDEGGSVGMSGTGSGSNSIGYAVGVPGLSGGCSFFSQAPAASAAISITLSRENHRLNDYPFCTNLKLHNPKSRPCPHRLHHHVIQHRFGS